MCLPSLGDEALVNPEEPSTDYRAVSMAPLDIASLATSQCPSKLSQVLRFKKLEGFRVHQEKHSLQDSSRKGRHFRIQSNTSGLLRISIKSYTASKVSTRWISLTLSTTYRIASTFPFSMTGRGRI
ncbi:hypothetical protein PAXRUDRAFT_393150 [Paxillus rubicundulus Ve08.2h10]|uniref:Uncharacterized protein n=1 Tax=Paxillus rubicundulus Ve08.2h10 TaxID=930991 RepID=A0A0D0DGT9_9AGAM|nr:hypothetical protein PAXRUDRAFT_393150 [Paxillus rubicundulus Ve08.2h10]